MGYGTELIIDMSNCDIGRFNREAIEDYMVQLCELINMERSDLHFWDDIGVPEEEKETEPHLVGTSAIQFITTSNITIHTLDVLEEVYINIFSCKWFDTKKATDFTESFFGGKHQELSPALMSRGWESKA